MPGGGAARANKCQRTAMIGARKLNYLKQMQTQNKVAVRAMKVNAAMPQTIIMNIMNIIIIIIIIIHYFEGKLGKNIQIDTHVQGISNMASEKANERDLRRIMWHFIFHTQKKKSKSLS